MVKKQLTQKEERDSIFLKLKKLGYKLRKVENHFSCSYTIDEKYFRIDINFGRYFSRENRIVVTTADHFYFKNREDGIKSVYDGETTRRSMYFPSSDGIDLDKLQLKINEIIVLSKNKEKYALSRKIYEDRNEDREIKNKKIIEAEFSAFMTKEYDWSKEKIFKLGDEKFRISVSNESDDLFNINFFKSSCIRKNLNSTEVREFIESIIKIDKFFKSEELNF